MSLPPTSALVDPVVCMPDWVARYAAIPNTMVSSGCTVNAQGNVPCDPAEMARRAGQTISRAVSLEAYTLARYITSEVGTRSVPERVAVAQAAVNRVKNTERLGSVLDLLLYRQKAGHPNRGFYGPIHGAELSAPYGRWASTSRDPALSNLIIAIDVLNGTIPTGFAKGADDQYGPEILVRKQGLETTQNGVRARGRDRKYWVGPLPGVDHQRTFLYTTRPDIDPSSQFGQALIARGVAAIAAPRPDWTRLPTCASSWAPKFGTGFGAVGIILGAIFLALGGVAFAKAFRRRALGSGLGRPLGAVTPYTYEEFSERIAEAKERPAFFEKTAKSLQDAANAVAKRGDAWGGRKVFIADLAKQLGTTPDKIAGPLLVANNRGWLALERADLTAAMDADKGRASAVVSPMESSFHFVLVQPGKTLGVTARRGARTGAIEVDPDDVRRVVDNAVATFGECDPGPGRFGAFVEPPSEVKLGRIQVHDAATGEKRRVPVSLFTRATKAGPLVTGSMATETEESGTFVGQSIMLKPRAACEHRDTWRQALAETLTHEAAHTSDPMVIKRAQKRGRAGRRSGSNFDEQAYRDYVNDPIEVTANVAAVRADLDKVRVDEDDAPDHVLMRSDRWRNLRPFLSEPNKRRFYRMAARVRDERDALRAEIDKVRAAEWAAEDAAQTHD